MNSLYQASKGCVPVLFRNLKPVKVASVAFSTCMVAQSTTLMFVTLPVSVICRWVLMLHIICNKFVVCGWATSHAQLSSTGALRDNICGLLCTGLL